MPQAPRVFGRGSGLRCGFGFAFGKSFGVPSIYSLGNRLRTLGTSLGNSFTTLHPRLFNRLYHSEWCSKPLSEFGQKLIPGSRRAANYTLISLLDDRRRHGDHILGTMHTKRGFCLGWLNTDTFLEKCEGGVCASQQKNSILKSYI